MKYTNKNKPLICMMKNSTCYRGTGPMAVKGILWHSTGCNNPTLKRYVQPSPSDPSYKALMAKLGTNYNKNSWNQISVQAGVNAWIGKLANGAVTTVQTLPWNYRPWGCGSGWRGSCNNGWIQFEICEDGMSDRNYFNTVYKEACELTAYLCVMYNLNPKGTVTVNGAKIPVILCHIDSYHYGMGSAHSDVLHWFKKHGKTMADVRNDVQKIINDYKKELQKADKAAKKEEKKANKAKKVNYRAKVTATSLNVRKQPNTSAKIVKTVKKGKEFSIVKEKNGFGKLKSGNGWVSLKWVKKV